MQGAQVFSLNRKITIFRCQHIALRLNFGHQLLGHRNQQRGEFLNFFHVLGFDQCISDAHGSTGGIHHVVKEGSFQHLETFLIGDVAHSKEGQQTAVDLHRAGGNIQIQSLLLLTARDLTILVGRYSVLGREDSVDRTTGFTGFGGAAASG